jgi:hypothetical protein
MTRTQELQSIGLFRIDDIAEKIQKHKDVVRYRIKRLGLLPFEKWRYDEHRLEMIINFEIYKKEL